MSNWKSCRVLSEVKPSIAMCRAAEALVEGKITFDVFVSRTSVEWRRVAARAFTRHVLPRGVQAEDVYQECILGAWFGAQGYDAARSGNPAGHLLGQAFYRAGKFCASQRGRKGKRAGDWKLPGRFPIAESSLALRGEEDEAPTVDTIRGRDGVLEWDAHDARQVDRAARDLVAAERVNAFASLLGEVHRPALECLADAGGRSTLAEELFLRHPESEMVGAWTPSDARARIGAARDGILQLVAEA